MIPYKYLTVAPLIEPYARYLHLTAKNNQFGDLLTEPEHLINRLNNFVSNISQPLPYNIRDLQTSLPFPNIDREKVAEPNRVSDVILKDTARQYRGIEERYRKGLVPLEDYRQWIDGPTRFHTAGSRGFERRLIRQINRLDGEFINRASLKPLI